MQSNQWHVLLKMNCWQSSVANIEKHQKLSIKTLKLMSRSLRKYGTRRIISPLNIGQIDRQFTRQKDAKMSGKQMIFAIGVLLYMAVAQMHELSPLAFSVESMKWIYHALSVVLHVG